MRYRSLNRITIGAGAALAALAGAWALYTESPSSQAEMWLRQAIEDGRPTQGALYDFPYAPRRATPTGGEGDQTDRTREAIANAVYHARETDDPRNRMRLLATAAIARGDVDVAMEILEGLWIENPDDAGIINDLGVASLELADDQPQLLLEAMDRFLAASVIDPDAAPIHFNIALTFRKLLLPEAADRWIAEHLPGSLSLGSLNPWIGEIDATDPDRPATSSRPEFESLSWDQASDDLTAWWSHVVETGLRVPEPIDWTSELETVVESYAAAFDDRSPRAILEPLAQRDREVIAIRETIRRAQDDGQINPARIVEILDQVSEIVDERDEEDFDRIRWAMVRAENIYRITPDQDALDDLKTTVETARQAGFLWLYGNGLTSTAAALSAGGLPVLLETNQRAIEVLTSIGAETDTLRAHSNLVTLSNLVGDWTESFREAHRTLRLSPPDDVRRRMYILDLLVENPILADQVRHEYLRKELHLSLELPPAERAYAVSQAASVYAAMGEPGIAEQHIREVKQIGQSVELTPPTYLRLGRAEARVLGIRGASEESDAFFDDAVRYFEDLGLDSFVYPFYLERAEWYRNRGDAEAAAVAFDDALEIIENSHDELQGGQLFDPERRRGYEQIIDFHLERDPRTGWEYVRRYKSKLDATLMPQFGLDAPVERAWDEFEVPRLDDRLIVEYTLLEDRIVIWVIDSGVVEVRTSGLDRDRLTGDVERFVHLLGQEADPEVLSALGVDLYQTLVAPVEDFLDPGRSLVIVPDRILYRLPFAALTSPEGRFLAEDFAIVEATTLDLALKEADVAPPAPRMLAIGSPGQSIPVRRELEALGEIHPSVEMLDTEGATPGTVVDFSRGASMIHIAGHSAVDGATGLSSAILLDGIDGENRITAAQVAGMELAPGALVVLSSCDSSVGNSIGGIGVRGLTSAFIAAGAGAVVGSLWPVDDAATGELMRVFHQYLREGRTIAESMRSAQVDFIQAGRHPYEWAAFTVTGDQSATAALAAATTVAATVFP